MFFDTLIFLKCFMFFMRGGLFWCSLQGDVKIYVEKFQISFFFQLGTRMYDKN